MFSLFWGTETFTPPKTNNGNNTNITPIACKNKQPKPQSSTIECNDYQDLLFSVTPNNNSKTTQVCDGTPENYNRRPGINFKNTFVFLEERTTSMYRQNQCFFL